MFFGGRDSEGRPANPDCRPGRRLSCAAGRESDPGGDQPGREIEADRGGAELSGDPRGLASALQKIQAYACGTPMPPAEQPGHSADDDRQPALGGRLKTLFSKNLSNEARVERLLAMAAAPGAARQA